MTQTVDSIHVAHVAESIERQSDEDYTYEGAAGDAHDLLIRYPEVGVAVLAYMNDTMDVEEFDRIVKAAAIKDGA